MNLCPLHLFERVFQRCGPAAVAEILSGHPANRSGSDPQIGVSSTQLPLQMPYKQIFKDE